VTTPTTVQARFQLRADTAANWASVNPTLLNNEFGLETDTKKLKVGDGSTAWNSLAYFPSIVTGGTVLGNLEIGTTGTLTFEGSTADGFETTLAVVNPTADRTITLPNVTGTVITTGDTGTVTSTMIADGTIVNADVNASAAIAHSKLANITAGFVLLGNASNVPTATALSGDVTVNSSGVTAISSGVIVDGDISATAEIAVSKLADGAARQVLQTDSAGTGVEWTDSLDLPGTLDVTQAATFDNNVTIQGDLTVNGTTTTIDTQNLTVEDKNVIIGNVTSPTDATADGGGITLKGTTDKTISWSDTTNAWTSSEVVDIPAGTAAAPSLIFGGDVNTGLYSPGADQVAISTGGSGRLFVDASGRLLVGTSTSIDVASSAQTLQVAHSSAGSASFSRFATASASGPFVTFGRSRSATIGTQTAVQNGDNLGRLIFTGSNGTDLSNQAVEIKVEVDGTPGTNDMPGRLVFSTTADGSATPTERLRIDSAGFISLGGDTDTGFSNPSANNLAFSTGGSERARIDSSGRLLVGTSTAFDVRVGVTAITPQQQLAGLNQSNSTFAIACANTTDASAGWLWLAKYASGTIGTNTTAVVADERLGNITFSGSDGSNQTQAASISAEVDGTPGTDDMPGRLVFSTTSDGASSPTERMRIRADGRTALGNSLSSAGNTNSHLFIYSAGNSSNTSNVGLETYTTSTSTRYAASFSNPNGVVGSISTNGSATAYNTSSDYRLKENVVPLTGAADRVKQLKPSKFNFIADPDTTVDGFLAHEAQAVVPECATGNKDEVDDEGNPVYQGIDQSKLVPLLTAALQEALQKIEDLEGRITAAGL